MTDVIASLRRKNHRFDVFETPALTFLTVQPSEWLSLGVALKETGGELENLTAVDRPEALEVVAHVSVYPDDVYAMKTQIGKDKPELDSLAGVWDGANWQERETYEFYGITFVGHPDFRRLLLMDDTGGFPLRKEFPLDDIEEDKEAPGEEEAPVEKVQEEAQEGSDS